MRLTAVLVDGNNCFVRLPPSIVSSIFEHSQSGFTPLVLELCWIDLHYEPRKVVVGWVGEASSDNEVVEVPLEFGRCIGLPHNQSVEVKIQKDVAVATQVIVEPFSPDDWEIVELHQEYLEEQILNQINVVFEGQVFPLWIRQQTVIHLKIVSTTPSSCVRLVPDAEVVIAPKPRAVRKSKDDDASTVIIPSRVSTRRKIITRRLRVQEIYYSGTNHTIVGRDNNVDDEDEEETKQNSWDFPIPPQFCVLINPVDFQSFSWTEGEIMKLSSFSKRERDAMADGGSSLEGLGPLGGLSGLPNLGMDFNGKLDNPQERINNLQLKQPKTTFVRAYPHCSVARRHVMICEQLRNLLELKLLTVVKVTPANVVVPAKFRSIQLRRLVWERNEPSPAASKNSISARTALPASIITKAFHSWCLSLAYGCSDAVVHAEKAKAKENSKQESKKASEHTIPLTNGSIVSLPILEGEAEGNFVLIFDLDTEGQDNNQSKGSDYSTANGDPRDEDKLYLLDCLSLRDTNTLPFDVSFNTLPLTYRAAEPLPKPDKTLEELGAVDTQVQSAVNHLSTVLKYSSIHRSISLPPPTGLVVLHGLHGCGKSSLALALAQRFQNDPCCRAYTLFMGCSQYTGVRIETVKAKWRAMFTEALKNGPSVIVLDDLDLLVPPEQELQIAGDSRGLLLTQYLETLLCCVEHAVRRATLSGREADRQRIAVIATAQSVTSLHVRLRTSGNLALAIEISPPTREGRVQILEKILQKRKLPKDDSVLNLSVVAGHTEGYLGADMQLLVERAIHAASMRLLKEQDANSPGVTFFFAPIRSSETGKMNGAPSEISLTTQDFLEAQEGFTPSSLKGIKLHKSDVSWSDVGGLDEVRQILKETLEWPTKHSSLFKSCPLRLRSGLLLYGPPGCGKTLLASAVAKECGLNFISIKGPELLNKYIGATEQAVRDLFTRATAAKPCVLFFDEFDSIAPRRGHDNTGVTDRVVNQLLTQLDGVETLQGVYVLAATSRPDLIDPALLRPGRLDKSLFCNMPTVQERVDILKAIGNKVKLAEDVDLEEVARWTNHYSGADLQSLVYNAQLMSIHDLLDETDGPSENGAVSATPPSSVAVISLDPEQSKVSLTRSEQARITQQVQSICKNWQSGRNVKGVQSKAAAQQREGTGIPVVRMVHISRAFQTSGPSVSGPERKRYQDIYSNFMATRGDFGLGGQPDSKQTLA